jgi:hypothetical protein
VEFVIRWTPGSLKLGFKSTMVVGNKQGIFSNP